MSIFDHFLSTALNLQPLFAAADAGGESSTLKSIIFTFLPLVCIGVIIWFFFIRGMKANQAKYSEDTQRHQQHMERVEQTLERIATALEKSNSSDRSS